MGCVALILLTVFSIPHTRYALLRAMGHALVVGDPIGPADAIVIATDADGAGVLEAVDLVHQGVSSRVALFSDPPGLVDQEFLRRGVPYFNEAAESARELHGLGVMRVEVITRLVAGTEDEGLVLPAWCIAHGIHTVIFVSNSDHSRRTRRVLARAAKGTDLKFSIHPSPYSKFDPDSWWQQRGGVRTEIIELEKLLLDMVRHPFSATAARPFSQTVAARTACPDQASGDDSATARLAGSCT